MKNKVMLFILNLRNGFMVVLLVAFLGLSVSTPENILSLFGYGGAMSTVLFGFKNS